MIQDFHLNLAAVRVTGERQLNAEFGGAIERIRIVREENIGDIATHQRLDTRKKLLLLSAAVVFTLIIHAEQIELGALERNLLVRMAEQLHPCLSIEIACFIFRVRIDFVIAIAAPSPQGRIQMADLVHAVGNRITRARDQVACDDRKICSEVVGHVHRAPHLRAGHVAAQVNVA